MSKETGRPGLRVLLVEDENLVALLLEEMIAELGHSVLGPVARVSKAVEIAQRELIDFAILDVNVNGEEAYPIADALAVRGIPFAFSTGYGKKSLREPYRDRPAVHKPFRQADLQDLFTQVFP